MQRKKSIQQKLNLIKLTSIIYNNNGITLSIYFRLNKSIIHIKNGFTKLRVTCNTSHIRKVSKQNTDYPQVQHL
jgi:hypothetical protein